MGFTPLAKSIGLSFGKTYDITLSKPATAGSTGLKPGVYKITIEGSQATFKDMKNNKTVTVPVKVEPGPRKFNDTRIETVNQNGMDMIQAIDLGGSNNRATLGQ